MPFCSFPLPCQSQVVQHTLQGGAVWSLVQAHVMLRETVQKRLV